MRLHKALPLFGLLTALPTLAFAYGTRVATQDAEATARGNAFAATADDPSAIYYNPAGLMQSEGFNAELGDYGIWIDEGYKPLHGQADAHESTAHEGLQDVPSLFLSYRPANQAFAFGFGIYSPFGLKTEWPDDASFRTSGVYGSLEFISFTPTFAVQITRTFSAGFGISANYENAELRQGLTSSPGDSFTFKGDGMSVSVDAGLMWQPTERQSIGLSYHSPDGGGLSGHTQQDLNATERHASEAGNAALKAGKQQLEAGIAQINALPIPASAKASLIANATAQYNAAVAASGVGPSGSFPTSFPTLAANGSLKFPQYAVLGYSFRPTPAWNLEADIDWTDWDDLNTFDLSRQDGSTVKVPFNWTHSFLYELGATYLVGPYKLSAGYIYSENSVPSASFNPIIPDSARNIFSVGAGRSFGNFRVDVAYELSLGGTRTIVNDSAADGRYSFLSNAVSISLGYHF